VDTQALQLGEAAREVITKVRDIRNQNQLKPKEPVGLFVVSGNGQVYDPFRPILVRLAGLHTFAAMEAQPENAIAFVANKDRFFVTAEATVDAATERERLEKEIEYTKGFMKSVQAKLGNARFVDHAPEAVVAKERQKLDDAAQKLKGLEEALGRL
jgi:valyl-tRNA synthetase